MKLCSAILPTMKGQPWELSQLEQERSDESWVFLKRVSLLVTFSFGLSSLTTALLHGWVRH